MTTPCAPNPIGLSQINTEFGRGYSLVGYHGVKAGVPASGQIAFSNLRCLTKYVPAGTNGVLEQWWEGAGSLTLPANTTEIRIIMIAGGGGGGGAYGGGTATFGAGGGAGGWLDVTFAINAGTALSWYIGGGGGGGGISATGGTGGTSAINVPGINYWECYGGGGGHTQSGAGGGGGGPSGAGNAGGEAISGNLGGYGGTSRYQDYFGGTTNGAPGWGANGTAGFVGGGGGGGSGSNDGGWRTAGGAGGAGYIRIYY